MKLPVSKYFDLPVSVWSHSLNAKEPWNESLGDFLSGDVFTDRRIRIKIKDFQWFFKSNKDYGNKSIVDPAHYRTIERIVDGKSIPEIVTSLREYVAIHGKDKVVDAIKKMIPGATVSAQFDRIRGKNHPKTLNNMIALDIDGVDPQQTIKKLASLNLCFWISKSITGTGVYALVPLATSNLAGHFEAINLLLQKHGIDLDPLKDETRLRYWSPPDDAVINNDVKPFEEVYNVPEEIKINRGSKENPVVQLKPTTKYDSHGFAQACHKKGLKNASTNLGLTEGEIGDHLHNFMSYYHWAFNHYGISLQYAVEWTWENFFKGHSYIKTKEHSIDKIRRDFTGFYRSYINQHHIFDFDKLKENSLGNTEYDMELTLPVGKKLSSIHLPMLFTDNELKILHNRQDWTGWNNYLLDSPTNSGKTSTFTKFFINEKVKGLIVVPTQGALEQIESEYREVKLFYEKSKKVKNEDILICTTYASFGKLSGLINMRERFLVVDEFHNAILSSSKEFRNYEMNSILDRLSSFSKVVLMTGTNLKCHHPALSNFKKLKVKYDVDTQKHLQIVYYKSANRWNTVMSHLKQYSSLQVIYLDDKQESKGLGKLINALKALGYRKDEIQLANSDQKHNEQYQDMILSGKIKEGIKIIIATKIFVEALNLYDNVSAFHILTPIHGAYMQQLVTRPRHNKQCDVFLYWHEDNLADQDITFWFDQERYYQSQVNMADNFIRAFEDTEWDDIHRKSFNGNDVVRKRKIDRSDEKPVFGELQTFGHTKILDRDYLNCDYNTQELQKKYYTKNPNQLFEYLKQYNWQVKPANISHVKEDSIDKSALKALRTIEKNNAREFIWELIQSGKKENEDRVDSKNYGTIAWQIQLRTRYLYLTKVLQEQDANELMVMLQDNKKAFTLLTKRINIRQALINPKTGASDTRDFAMQLFEDFPLKSVWSSVEILKKINSLQELSFKSVYAVGRIKTATAATQLLNQYVEVKRTKKIDSTGKPTSGRKKAYVNSYEIISHHPIRNFDGEAIEPIQQLNHTEHRTPSLVTWIPLPEEFWVRLAKFARAPVNGDTSISVSIC